MYIYTQVHSPILVKEHKVHVLSNKLRYRILTVSATMAGQKDRRCVEENLRRRVLKLRNTSEDTTG